TFLRTIYVGLHKKYEWKVLLVSLCQATFEKPCLGKGFCIFRSKRVLDVPRHTQQAGDKPGFPLTSWSKIPAGGQVEITKWPAACLSSSCWRNTVKLEGAGRKTSNAAFMLFWGFPEEVIGAPQTLARLRA
ncbi:MAG: hypothetical protein M1482_13400, partial [Chloroflexi bacterium]|nr:hypothetical protein [Chloroflexota bacterium]